MAYRYYQDENEVKASFKRAARIINEYLADEGAPISVRWLRAQRALIEAHLPRMDKETTKRAAKTLRWLETMNA